MAKKKFKKKTTLISDFKKGLNKGLNDPLTQSEKDKADSFGAIVAFVILFVVGATIMHFVIEGGKGVVSGVFNSEAKDFCSTSARVRMSKTDYAAKQAFKECMRNY
jgi:hypothetical protein